MTKSSGIAQLHNGSVSDLCGGPPLAIIDSPSKELNPEIEQIISFSPLIMQSTYQLHWDKEDQDDRAINRSSSHNSSLEKNFKEAPHALNFFDFIRSVIEGNYIPDDDILAAGALRESRSVDRDMTWIRNLAGQRNRSVAAVSGIKDAYVIEWVEAHSSCPDEDAEYVRNGISGDLRIKEIFSRQDWQWKDTFFAPRRLRQESWMPSGFVGLVLDINDEESAVSPARIGIVVTDDIDMSVFEIRARHGQARTEISRMIREQ